MLKKYKEVTNQIAALNIKKGDKAKALILSIILSLIIASGPIILVVNLFVFTDYIRLLAFILATIIFMIFYLSEFFYLNIICDKSIKGKSICYLIDLALPFIAVYLVVIILMIKGVI